jgi:hypothetical protein
MDDDGGWDLSDYTPEPAPTKTIGQSIGAIVLALAVGVGAVSLLLIHSVASFIGVFVWTAATLAPGFAVAQQLDKHMMVGYHIPARLIVGGITFFSVAVFIGVALNAHRF